MRAQLVCGLLVLVAAASMQHPQDPEDSQHPEASPDRQDPVAAQIRSTLRDTAADFWIYDDLEKGYTEAAVTGKPLLVSFRCVP